MQGRQGRHAEEAQRRIREVIQMAVNDVELVGAARDLFQLHEKGGEWISDVGIEAQCARPYRNQLGTCFAVARGEKRYIVPELHEGVRQISHYTFGPTIEFR